MKVPKKPKNEVCKEMFALKDDFWRRISKLAEHKSQSVALNIMALWASEVQLIW